MSMTRRFLGQFNDFAGRVWNVDTARQLDDILDKIRKSVLGYPTPHNQTHLVGQSDPLQTPGMPTGVGVYAAVGKGPSYAREDHQHAFTAWREVRAYVSLRVG